MKSDDSDDLRFLFQERRRGDARNAPSFARLLASAQVERPAARPHWGRLAAAGVLGLALVSGLWIGLPDRQPTRPTARVLPTPGTSAEANWEFLSTWEASTDTLLVDAGPSWMNTPAASSDDLIPAESVFSDTLPAQ